VIVKMCGFTRPADAAFAREIGVDMIGVVLVGGSPRCISVGRAREVLAAAGNDVMGVVVFRPSSIEEVERIGKELKPDYLQLHYGVPLELVGEIRDRTGFRTIGVVPVPIEGAEREEIKRRAREISELCDMVLMDTKGPHGGGTGVRHDWKISAEVRRGIRKPVLLAGGLTPENVQEAIAQVSPDGVDVATGVESGPGIKDRELMREFMNSVRKMER